MTISGTCDLNDDPKRRECMEASGSLDFWLLPVLEAVFHELISDTLRVADFIFSIMECRWDNVSDFVSESTLDDELIDSCNVPNDDSVESKIRLVQQSV
jgi:hypothetical protein